MTTNAIVVNITLDGQNYPEWAFCVETALRGHGLLFHLTDAAPVLADDRRNAADIKTWQLNDGKVMAAMVNSVKPSMIMSLSKFKTAKAIWSHLKERFVQDSGALLHTLMQQTHVIEQNDMSIDEYYSAFDRLMSALTSMVPACTADPCPAHKFIEKFFTYRFVMGVRAEFDSLRARLLQGSDTLTMAKALSDLLAEETRLHSLSSTGGNPHSVLAAAQKPKNIFKPCDHCGKTNHRSELCFVKFPEKLTDFRARRAARGRGPGPSTRGSVAVAATSSACTSESAWVLDSGASFHVTSDQSKLASTTPVTDGASVQTADGTVCHITHKGSLSDPHFTVPNIFFVPELSMDLLSVGQITDHNCFVGFDDSSCFVQDLRTGEVIGTGRRRRAAPRLYILDSLRLPSLATSPAHVLSATLASVASFAQWHHRLGHLCGSRLSTLIKSGCLGHTSVESDFHCKGCHLGKQIQLPYFTSDSHSVEPFDLVHSDIWGPAPFVSKGGYKYYVIFIDDHSRYTWIYFMKRRSELISIYKTFARMIHTQFSTHIKIFRSDSGGEYLSDNFRQFLTSEGTLAQLSCPGAHAQNGVAERKHRHIIETARTLLISSFVPSHFWGEAVSTAVYLINRQPSSKLSGKTPGEVLFGTPPRYDHLRVFGCTCYVLLSPRERTKLTAQSVECVFLGYSPEHKGYRCYDSSSRRMRISRDVSFNENRPFFYNSSTHSSFYSTESTSFMSLPPISETSSVSPPTVSTPDVLIPITPPSTSTPSQSYSSKPPVTQTYIRRPRSTPTASPDDDPVADTCTNNDDSHVVFNQGYHLRDRGTIAAPERYGFSRAGAVIAEPSSYKEASGIPEWQLAMTDELNALHRTCTWDVVPLPAGVVPITCKWVFKVKTKSDGSIERYKARLVARGFQQTQGIDYDETFAPVAHLTTVRALLAVAASSSWTISQMDVKNAFLHGDLHEEVYMHPPPGIEVPSGHVCRLRRALYGLKQAPRAWFERFVSVIKACGFYSSDHDPALFIHVSSRGRTLLLLYVDDMLITGDDPDHIDHVKTYLSKEFQMSDLGALSYFLGIEVLQTQNGIYLSQAKYIQDLLDRSGLSDTRTVATPMDLHLSLRPTDGTPLEDPSRYRHLVGSLVYLTVTRPDIAHAVQILSQFVSAPTSVHYGHLLRVLRYLRGTKTQCLFYDSNSPLQLHAYSDATWASDPTDRRSITGYCILLGSSPVAWKSKKQAAVSRSSTEAELRALATTTAEIIWIRWLLADLGVSCDSPTLLRCDNTGAIQICHDPVKRELTKHIGVDVSFTRSHCHQKTIDLQYVPSELQLADFFTKAQTRAQHQFHLIKLNASNPPLPP